LEIAHFPVFYLSQLVFWFVHLSIEIAFSPLALAFQLFTRKHCLQIPGLRMDRVITWNRFPIYKNCWL